LYSNVSKIYRKTVNLGVKQAMFFVLMGANMPSILAEVSFISNPEEEKLLSRESYRKILAGSIASGIRTYFASSSPVQKVALIKRGPFGSHSKSQKRLFAGR
ncbi:MAG TPA: N-acetylmuramoyl-L-alanine amidase, partial [Thermodesulfovibrionales bacterium]|nr:N-acetylmuramoyl-L-alanine amidase [Thermodesulfovibrionales bacterium]